MVINARYRAKKLGVPFNIDHEDFEIPKKCPILGIPLKHSEVSGYSPNSPSLDRIVPEFGYCRGNVVVLSNRANTIKNNATPQELEAVATWLRKALRPS